MSRVDIDAIDMTPVMKFRVKSYRKSAPLSLRYEAEGEDPAPLMITSEDAAERLGAVPSCSCGDCRSIRANVAAAQAEAEQNAADRQVTLGNSELEFTRQLPIANRSQIAWCGVWSRGK